MCDPLDGNNSIIDHLYKFSCQNVQTTKILVTIFAFGLCKLSHVSNNIYAKNSLNIIHVHVKFALEWQSLFGVNTLT